MLFNPEHSNFLSLLRSVLHNEWKDSFLRRHTRKREDSFGPQTTPCAAIPPFAPPRAFFTFLKASGGQAHYGRTTPTLLL